MIYLFRVFFSFRIHVSNYFFRIYMSPSYVRVTYDIKNFMGLVQDFVISRVVISDWFLFDHSTLCLNSKCVKDTS